MAKLKKPTKAEKAKIKSKAAKKSEKAEAVSKPKKKTKDKIGKKPKKSMSVAPSGVLGFCYRSPAVVKFMLPTQTHGIVNVDERGTVTTPLSEIAKFSETRRTIVFMHKSLAGFRVFVTRMSEGSNKSDLRLAHHIVFDTHDQLSRYAEIEIMDLKGHSQADWQVQKTYPELIAKKFEEHGPGIRKQFVDVITDHLLGADPEDMIHTDKKVKDSERQEKAKSMLHVIQDLQAKNADKRNAISRLVCGFVAGQFIDENHVVIEKPIRVCKDADRCVVPARLISAKKDKLAFERSLGILAERFKELGLPLRRPALEKIGNLVNKREYIATMRALLLVEKYGYSPDQASARTGANICAVSLIRREVFTETATLNARDISKVKDDNRHTLGAVTLVKRTQAQANFDVVFRNPELRVWNKFKKALDIPEDALPATVREAIVEEKTSAPEQAPELEAATEKVKNKSPRKTIRAGTYSLTDVIVACHLADPSSNPMAILSMSKQAVTFTATRFRVKKKNSKTHEVVYKLEAGQKHRLRWRGTLYRVHVT